MRKMLVSIVLLACLFCVTATAQTSYAFFPITVYQPERDFIMEDAARLLETKMTQVLTACGIVSDDFSNRFVLTAKVNVLSKDIIAGSPVRVSEKLEVTFIIGDVIDNIKYGSYSMDLIGVGLNENKALISAVNRINGNKPELRSFIEETKRKIERYYIENTDNILNTAQTLANGGQYDEALYYLAQVPSASPECYARCQERMVEIMRQKVNNEGQTLLGRAKSVWAKAPNASSASEVARLVASISPLSSCYSQIDPFLKQVESKLTADEKREWEFKMRQYEDEKAREQRDFEQAQKVYEDMKVREQRDFEYKKLRDAANDITRRQFISSAMGVAAEFARHQPSVVQYSRNIILW